MYCDVSGMCLFEYVEYDIKKSFEGREEHYLCKLRLSL